MHEVYINKTSFFLPNDPVENDDMESYLGLIDGIPSKSKSIVLSQNGIKKRYYAITKEGKSTHSNAELTSLAVRGLFKSNSNNLATVDFMACGTSSPDLLIPSHGVMVHGLLKEIGPIEVVTSSGNCCSGIHAFKHAYQAIRLGEAQYSVSTGSERASLTLHSKMFKEEIDKLHQLISDPIIGFEKDFLRWMLSDGAAAFLMTPKKNTNEISLRVEWVENISFANEADTCMYSGGVKLESGEMKSYQDFSNKEIIENSILSLKQDVKILRKNIVKYGGIALVKTLKKRNITPEQIDYFLPHFSSLYFKEPIIKELKSLNIEIPKEKWFYNLTNVGNVGSASAYLMLDELFRSGRLKTGEKIMILVPESARFSYSIVWLTVC